MKKPYILLGTLIFVIIALFGVRTVVNNGLSTSGVVLGSAQDEASQYKSENIMLKEKIYTLSSLSHVSTVATKMGFVESKSDFALTKAQPIALKQ